jgi:hypothetical protein
VGLALGQLTCCATFDPGLNETLLGRGVLLEATHHQARLADEIRLSLPVARAFIWHPAPAARPEQLGAIGDESITTSYLPKKNLAGESQSFAGLTVASVATWRKCPPLQPFYAPDRFCRQAETEVVIIKWAFLALWSVPRSSLFGTVAEGKASKLMTKPHRALVAPTTVNGTAAMIVERVRSGTARGLVRAAPRAARPSAVLGFLRRFGPRFTRPIRRVVSACGSWQFGAGRETVRCILCGGD